MSRLADFRALMRSLDPSGDPRVAVKHGWTAERPASSSAAVALARRLELEPWSTHLMFGGVGSGKTTELWRVFQRLVAVAEEQKTGDVARYIDVAAEHRLDSLRPGILVALAGRYLVRLEGQVRRARGDHTVAPEVLKAREAIQKVAEGHLMKVPRYEDTGPDEPDWEGPDPDDEWDYIRVPGLIKPPQPPIDDKVADAIGHLRTLRDAVVGSEGHCVFLFDSLDRVPVAKSFESDVRDDLRALKQAKIGTVVVGPIRFQYGAARAVGELVDKVHFVSEVEPVGDGLAFLSDVLGKRVPSSLLSVEGRVQIARASGGVLRDLVAIAKLSAEEAYVAGTDEIAAEHIARAVDQFGRARAVGLDSEQVAALRKVRETQKFVLKDERDYALLETRRVLDWGGGRFVVHPTLEPLLAVISEAAA